MAESRRNRLREYRQRLGMTQTALAAQLEWNQGKYSQIESGKLRPSVEDIETLAKAFGFKEATVRGWLRSGK